MALLRSGMLALARNERITELVTRNGFSKGFALRFVAGETLDEALAVANDLHRRGFLVTLDALGENVTSEEAAREATDAYLEMLDRLGETDIEGNISIKLTMLGLDISDDFCRRNTIAVLERAKERGAFVRIDMEGSPYTQRTLDLAYELFEQFPETVGIVLQSYLYRTQRDVRHAIERGIRVRMVKGAYAEPSTIAYPNKQDVDAAYRRETEMLLEAGIYTAVATHDLQIIEATKDFAHRKGIDPSRFEFQMLYGIRRDLQERLLAEGYRVRVYLPFGTEWYPYFMRRMAERPANLLFVLRNLIRR